jgi:hypothetical protein
MTVPQFTHLTAGDVDFMVEQLPELTPPKAEDTKRSFSRRQPAVYVSSARRDEYLGAGRPRDKCTVLAGRVVPGWAGPFARISFDGAPSQSVPGAAIAWRSSPPPGNTSSMGTQLWLAPTTLEPGEHRLDIPPVEGTAIGATTSFNCASGDVVYAVIALNPPDLLDYKQLDKQVGQLKMQRGEITVTREMPVAFRDQPLLLYRADEWRVPAEPKH